jgi:hypothetical protein
MYIIVISEAAKWLRFRHLASEGADEGGMFRVDRLERVRWAG